MKLTLKHALAAIMLALSFGILDILLCTQYGHALEKSEKIAVVAFEYEIRERLQNSFCLMMGGLIFRVLSDDAQPVGHGASNEVVSALKERGYNVFSSDDCVYKGILVTPRSSSESSGLIGIMPFKYDGEDSLLVSSGYQYEGSCQRNLLTIRKRNGNFSVTESKMQIIC